VYVTVYQHIARHIADRSPSAKRFKVFSTYTVEELFMNANTISIATKQAKKRATVFTCTLLCVASFNAMGAVDLGDASVLSQQGQRLKVAVVYGSGPAERVPVTRFSVAEVRAEGTAPAPKAELFTISAPEKRNIVFLQSKEIVRTDKIQIVMTAADNPSKKVVYDLLVPPAKSAVTDVEPMAAKKVVSKKKRSKTKMRRAKRR
jgi:hypothetical protein